MDSQTLQSIKQRFHIIGNSPLLNRAIDIAAQVASTDLSVLVIGESGVGKEFFPKIIHELSPRKHRSYVAINCGAIPEGTIDSELFGHEKGAFTDARESRKGYFEEADGGTIFLDEVAELPLSTQVRLLRVLETGEFMKVGSSKVLKTNVRVVAATNVNVPQQIQVGKFREDLYYRLNAITIQVPSLKERPEDIELIFRKFSADICEKYRIPARQLSPEARQLLVSYSWPGNVRQLKNVSEQVSIICQNNPITAQDLKMSLPEEEKSQLPMLLGHDAQTSGMSERDILYRVLFDMQRDIQQLKQAVSNMSSADPRIVNGVNSMEVAVTDMENGACTILQRPANASGFQHQGNNFQHSAAYHPSESNYPHHQGVFQKAPYSSPGFESNLGVVPEETPQVEYIHTPVSADEDLSLEKKEKDMIEKALAKYGGNRRKAAAELGISERTIYRKIKEYGISLDE